MTASHAPFICTYTQYTIRDEEAGVYTHPPDTTRKTQNARVINHPLASILNFACGEWARFGL